jgi:exopolyphosphatase/pppGpp-phosphohydrolase
MRIADRGLREGLLMGLAERRRRAARRKKTVHA